MDFLIVLGIMVFVLMFSGVFAAYGTYGYSSDEKCLQVLAYLRDKKAGVHGRNIISFYNIEEHYFITDTPWILRWFTQYYIQGIGFIPYWFKSHKEIVEFYTILQNQES